MLKAAKLWAEARQKGKPTADDKATGEGIILAFHFPESWKFTEFAIA